MRANRSSGLNRGVSSCIEDPEIAAPDADVFWRGGTNPYVVHVRIAPIDDHDNHLEKFDINEFRCRKTVLRFADGPEHALLRTPQETVQLLARGSSICGSNMGATFEIHGLSRTRFAIAPLKTLARMKASRKSHDSGSWVDGCIRFRNDLIALDGSLHGATYRQIAMVIYGPDRVGEVWTSGSRFMKERMRRAVETGRYYMNGGYRKILG
jgi:hypothetical protein